MTYKHVHVLQFINNLPKIKFRPDGKQFLINSFLCYKSYIVTHVDLKWCIASKVISAMKYYLNHLITILTRIT